MVVAARDTIDTLLKRLGVPATRVRLWPSPGTATEGDCIAANEAGSFCELVDGTLVEKPVGNAEEYLGLVLTTMIYNYVVPRRLGVVGNSKFMFRMVDGNIRLPDVSFTPAQRLPLPMPPIGDWCPDLCVEVLSPSNSSREMAVKRAEFFASGARVCWEINARLRTAKIFSSPTGFTPVSVRGYLSAPAVLPGFRISLAKAFREYDSIMALGT